jgi:hypothetical protein
LYFILEYSKIAKPDFMATTARGNMLPCKFVAQSLSLSGLQKRELKSYHAPWETQDCCSRTSPGEEYFLLEYCHPTAVGPATSDHLDELEGRRGRGEERLQRTDASVTTSSFRDAWEGAGDKIFLPPPKPTQMTWRRC